MSATSPTSLPTQERSFDENVAAIVKVLMATQDIDGKTLAPLVGMTKSTMYRRLKGEPWLAGELERMAEFFGIAPRVFFEPVEALGQNWKKNTGADLRLIEGGDNDPAPGPGQMALPFAPLRVVR